MHTRVSFNKIIATLSMPSKYTMFLTLYKPRISEQKAILIQNRLALNHARTSSVSVPSREHNSVNLLVINSSAPSYFSQTSLIIFLYVLILFF